MWLFNIHLWGIKRHLILGFRSYRTQELHFVAGSVKGVELSIVCQEGCERISMGMRACVCVRERETKEGHRLESFTQRHA